MLSDAQGSAVGTPLSPKDRADLHAILARMHAASDHFYAAAVAAGNHAFIEFTGLMNEYITVCHTALAQDIDFRMASTHTGVALPFKPHHAAYLAEKLDCIYGPALRSDDGFKKALLR